MGQALRSGEAPHVHAILHVTDEGAWTDEGAGVSGGTSERLTCDAHVTEVIHAAPDEAPHAVPGGAAGPAAPSILDVGRRTRTVSGRLRLALETRDRGRCRTAIDGRTSMLLHTDGKLDYGWALLGLRA